MGENRINTPRLRPSPAPVYDPSRACGVRTAETCLAHGDEQVGRIYTPNRINPPGVTPVKGWRCVYPAAAGPAAL